MNDFEKNLNLLKDKLFDEPVVKQYFLYKESIEKDAKLVHLKNEMVRLTKENKHNDVKILKEQYDNHPLINNFNVLKEEVKNLLLEIKEILNNQ